MTPRLCTTTIAALLLVLVAACGHDRDREAGSPGHAVEALPQPDPVAGAVTGMPTDPGPGDVPLAGEPPPPPPLFPAGSFGLPALADNPETGLGGDDYGDAGATDDALPGADAAVAVIAEYHAALQARDFARAYGLWAGDGHASGQTLDQFNAAFLPVAALRAQIGAPGPLEAAADTQQVQVPVGIAETLADGSVRRRAGVYVLRRSTADGAGTAQHAWRIASLQLQDAD